MKTRTLALIIAIVLSAAFCHAGNKQKPTTTTTTPATSEADAAAKKKEAKKAAKTDATGDTIPAGYPLKTCVVSGESLKPGKLYTFTYRSDNRPPCTVVLCCKNCVKEFEKHPDKYMDMVIAAKK